MKNSTKPKSAKAASKSKMPSDAIALLKADHKQVSEWFDEFSATDAAARKTTLASKICEALHIHTMIEEEIFYPAFIGATEDKPLHHEAIIEHDGAKKLIAAVEESGPDDDYFDAKVKVLSEMIKHHVKEEEQPGGMFVEARKSTMDLKTLGAEMLARKNTLLTSTNKRIQKTG